MIMRLIAYRPIFSVNKAEPSTSPLAGVRSVMQNLSGKHLDPDVEGLNRYQQLNR